MGLSSVFMCVLWIFFILDFSFGCELGGECTPQDLQNGVAEPRGRHRLQLLFPLLLRISTRLATLVPTALMGLLGIIVFVVFSKKALIVSLIALFLTLSSKYNAKNDEIYIHKVNSYPEYNDEEHIHYHHGPPKHKQHYYDQQGKWKPYKRIDTHTPVTIPWRGVHKPLSGFDKVMNLMEGNSVAGGYLDDTFGAEEMDGDGINKLPPPVDFSNLTPVERQKIKDSWLAVPRTPSVPRIGTPTLVRRTPFGLSVPALRAKCSPHTELLAVARNPLPQIHYVTAAEKEMQRELEEGMTKEELRWLKRKVTPAVVTGVRKSALKAKITPRVDAMSVAKLGALSETRKRYFHRLTDQQKKTLLATIKEHYSTFHANYPPEADKIYTIEGGTLIHACCVGKRGDKGKRVRYLCELNKNQRKSFRKRMKAMGLPKKLTLPDGGPDRGPKKKLKEFEPWITIISQPKYNVLNETPYNPFRVKSSAKTYIPTERVLKLAKPKELPPPPPITDFEGNELPPRREWSYTSRRRVIASPRTLELATPKFVKKKAAEDVKDDPFAVPRRALTAYCSPRTAELAEPRHR